MRSNMSLSVNEREGEAAQAETRQRLLEAAGEVFAECGFRNATVREICLRAATNIASVNYHFGDKETLYTEVLQYAQTKVQEKYPSTMGISVKTPPEERLKAFVRSFLLRIFDKGPIAWHGKLMAREMIDPTAALDSLVEEKIRPQADQLAGIVRPLLGGKPSEELIRLCSCSVVSQCLFYHHCRPVVERLFPQQRFDPRNIETLAEHITRFSLAALKQMSRARKKS